MSNTELSRNTTKAQMETYRKLKENTSSLLQELIPTVPNTVYLIIPGLFNDRSRGSSVGIVSDYELDNRAIEVRSPTGAEDFSSSPCLQTGSGAHPASCTMSTGGSSPGVKRGRGVTLTTHPHLVPRLSMSRSYNSTPVMCLHGV
jgi:hypothetical protein